ncbi:FixH family protein [Peribacillus acanthi]|uniref:FixH family protein n=1 Tax=Peribacillus acanthi TaxID=2171554 RepID=UPI000D3E17EF|nr:FixH family protein [Peribacillus acanthi]
MEKSLLLFMLLLIFLTGCTLNNGKNDINQKEEGTVAEPLIADMQIPDQAKTGETTTIAVVVSQNDKLVDATDVVFEIMKDGENTKQMIEATKSKQGTYEMNHIFQASGTFRITAHVTASNMHTMPEDKITIVQSEKTISSEISSNSEHHHSHVKFDFNQEGIYKLGVNELSVSITNDHLPLDKADVQFEVWMHDEDKHEYLRAKEISPGSYIADVSFGETGIYQIQIHVVKDEIHDHNSYKINIQN